VSSTDTYFSSPLHLPFNSSCLHEHFRHGTPDQEPGGPGYWVLLRGSELLLQQHADGVQLPYGVRSPDWPLLIGEVFIGRWKGAPCRLLNWPEDIPLAEGLVPCQLRDWGTSLPIELLSLGGLANQIWHWESNSCFCSRCGGPMVRLPHEWGKRCEACAAVHFPHIHPCAITLVRRPGEVLLTRKAEWPDGHYSLVAGFVNFGECLEETAVREIAEETGVRVKNLQYVGSQCWPFPTQLMAGFIADYAGGELVVDYGELADARWFSVDALPLMPPRRSISRYILDNYLHMSRSGCRTVLHFDGL
jgi:NAD+ diphosphatase